MEEASPSPSEPTVEVDSPEPVEAAEVGHSETLPTTSSDASGCRMVWIGTLVALGLPVFLYLLCAMQLWESAACLACVAIYVGVFYGIAEWIIGPLERAAKQVKAPLQFRIVDFLCLFFLVQMPMAVIHGWLAREMLCWVLDVFAWLAIGALWLSSVSRLSRAGIHRSGQRALFLAFVLPSAVLGTLVVPPLTSLVAGEIIGGGLLRQDLVHLTTTVGTELVLLVAMCAAGLVTRRMVAQAAEAQRKVE